MDNGAVLMAFDLKTGKRLWEKALGTIQKGSPVLADGKLYVGTENGKFYIIKPTASGPEILTRIQLGTAAEPEAIIASPAVARGRIYVASMDALYAIGPKGVPKARSRREAGGRAGRCGSAAPRPSPSSSRTRCCVKPGEAVRYRVRLFDDRGHFVREEPGATLHARGPEGRLRRHGLHAGRRRRRGRRDSSRPRAGTLTATARVRVVAAAAVELRLRGHDRRGAAALLDQLDRQVLPARLRGQPHADEAQRHPAHQARAALLRARRRVGLHGRGGRARDREAPPDGRRRRDRAALRARAVRQLAEARAAPLAGEPRPHRRGAVRLEAGDLVPRQAAGREPRRRHDRGARARPGRPPSRSPRPGRSTTSTRCRTGRAPPGIYADASAEIYFDNIKVTANK